MRLPPGRVIQCESYETALRRSDALGIDAHHMLDSVFAREYLRTITVYEPLPSYTAGIFMRSASPLTRYATAMIKALTVAACKLGGAS